MLDLQNLKFVNVTPPAAIIDNSAATTASVDRRGWDEVCFLVALGAMDIAVTALKLRESDDDSSYSDVPGADFSVSPLTLPSATDDNKLVAIFVNGVGRKAYLDLSITLGDGAAGTYVAVLAILARGKTAPSTATLRGLSQQAII
ncbi:MAG: hypothetical protein E6R03_02170 [Hyphomicrobiaceae bacterium]|nr:MAG: hypothetical protein E6R03_02170 [Hyphomicrobiaceae bacterium]